MERAMINEKTRVVSVTGVDLHDPDAGGTVYYMGDDDRTLPEKTARVGDRALSIRANDGMTAARMREILKTYTVLAEEHLEEARAFRESAGSRSLGKRALSHFTRT